MPDFPIVIKATDQFSAAMKTMRDSAQRFTKDMDGMQSRLNALNKTKATLKVDTDKAKSELKTAEKQFAATGDAISEMILKEKQITFEQARRNLSLVSKEASNVEKQMLKTGKAFSKAGNTAGGTSGAQSIINSLANVGAANLASSILQNAANATVASLAGSDAGTIFSSALSSTASGIAMGTMAGEIFGLPGAAVGAVAGGILGAASGVVQNWSKKDDAFKSYYQEAYETQISAQESSLVTGSALAAQREPRRVMQQHGQARTGNRSAADNSLFLTVSHNSPQAPAPLSGLLKIFRFPALRRSSLEIRGQALTNFHVRCIIIQNCWLRPACDDHWGSSRKQK